MTYTGRTVRTVLTVQSRGTVLDLDPDWNICTSQTLIIITCIEVIIDSGVVCCVFVWSLDNWEVLDSQSGGQSLDNIGKKLYYVVVIVQAARAVGSWNMWQS